VDAKHLRHTRVLAEFLGESCESVPASHLTKDVYVRDVTTYTCERCERSLHPDYPLAEKARIFEILGYV